MSHRHSPKEPWVLTLASACQLARRGQEWLVGLSQSQGLAPEEPVRECLGEAADQPHPA